MSRVDALRAQLDVVNAYRACFTDGDGALTESAALVFTDLGVACRVKEARPIRDQSGAIDQAGHVYRDGKRAVYEHIREMLSASPADIMSRIQAAERE